MSRNSLKHYALYLAWIQAAIAMAGSLYFSEVMKFPPCILCWYQRITMYPQVMILAIGIMMKDKKLPYYVIPVVAIGWGISLFHNLLYYKILPESAAPCIQGVSCTTKFIEWFGFITIPLLSFIAHSVILACMGFVLWLQKKEE